MTSPTPHDQRLDAATLADWAARGRAGQPCTRADALAVLRCEQDDLLDVVAAAAAVRRQFFGRRVKLNYLVNLKSGRCPEDCGYCSQSLDSAAQVLNYPWIPPHEALAAAEAGLAGGAARICFVASGRGPTDADVARVGAIVEALKEAHPGVETCACLGLLRDGQGEALRRAGVDAYNHNLNTAESLYPQVCSTHTYADRVDTVSRATNAGLSACSGLIVGLGESDDDLVDLAFALRDSGADSIPVNFLMPFDGTAYAGSGELTPGRCLRVLAMLRLVCPDREIRIGAGREDHLRGLQVLGLHVANSIFLGDYLTGEGAPGHEDLRLLRDAGFEFDTPHDRDAPVQARPRHRGVGTPLPANA